MSETNVWRGAGTKGRQANYGHARNQPTHCYRGYWWYVQPDGSWSVAMYCDHHHRTPEAAQRCGDKEAALRNRTLVRIGAAPTVGLRPD